MTPRRSGLHAVLAAAFLVGAAAVPQTAPAPVPDPNPLMARSTLPYQAPPFDRLKDTDYEPAIEAGMKEQLAEIARIADDPAPPTFANTIEAMERSGELLTRAYKVFSNLDEANTNDTLQKAKAVLAPKLSAHNDAIYLNPKLYARVQAIYDGRDSLGLGAEAKYLVERYQLLFVRSGAALKPADQSALMKINEEIAEQSDEVPAESPGGHQRLGRRGREEVRARRSLRRRPLGGRGGGEGEEARRTGGSSRCGTPRSSRRSPRSRKGSSARRSFRRRSPAAVTAEPTTPRRSCSVSRTCGRRRRSSSGSPTMPPTSSTTRWRRLPPTPRS